MEFKTTRASAIENLDNFIKNSLGEYSKLRNFDFGPDKRSNTSCLSPYITHGVINEEEVIQLSGCANHSLGIKKILTMGPKYIIMKKGEFGATLYSDESEFFCPSFKIEKVIDPTGAGDSFAGAFAGHLADSKNYSFISISNALIYANAVASFCVEKFGVENMLDI